jgi:hypothetical protein
LKQRSLANVGIWLGNALKILFSDSGQENLVQTKSSKDWWLMGVVTCFVILITFLFLKKNWYNDYNFVDLIKHKRIVETLAKYCSRHAIKLVETIRYGKTDWIFILFISL